MIREALQPNKKINIIIGKSRRSNSWAFQKVSPCNWWFPSNKKASPKLRKDRVGLPSAIWEITKSSQEIPQSSTQNLNLKLRVVFPNQRSSILRIYHLLLSLSTAASKGSIFPLSRIQVQVWVEKSKSKIYRMSSQSIKKSRLRWEAKMTLKAQKREFALRMSQSNIFSGLFLRKTSKI